MHKFTSILIFLLCFFSAAQAQELQQPVDTILSLNQLAIPADSVEYWKNSKPFEYAKWLDSLLKAKTISAPPASHTEPEPNWLDHVFASPLTRIIFWVLAGIFVLFILYKLFLANTIFRKKSKTASVSEVAEEVLNGESDYDTLINQSTRGGNYRLAVRYQYLKVLHKLAEKHFIEMAVDKTNYQYVREVASRGGLALKQQFQNDFAALTLSYEYVWYGEFAVDEDIYRKIATGFTQFNQKI